MQGNLASLAPDQLSVVLQYLPEGLVILGEDRRILALNSAAEALTGLRADEAVGQRACSEALVCTDRQGNPLCGACPHLTAAATHTAVSNASVTVRGANGLPVPVAATYFPLPSQPGEPRVDALILAELTVRPAVVSPGARPGTDPTTGLLSRERFEALYARERERAQRYQSGLAIVRVAVRPRLVAAADDGGSPPVAVADLDAALAAVGELLQCVLRTVDVVGRCDEYDCGVILPAANFAGVRSVVDRLEVGLRELMASGAVPPLVDVALGVALSEGYEDLLARCTQRLHSLTPGG